MIITFNTPKPPQAVQVTHIKDFAVSLGAAKSKTVKIPTYFDESTMEYILLPEAHEIIDKVKREKI